MTHTIQLFINRECALQQDKFCIIKNMLCGQLNHRHQRWNPNAIHLCDSFVGDLCTVGDLHLPRKLTNLDSLDSQQHKQRKHEMIKRGRAISL